MNTLQCSFSTFLTVFVLFWITGCSDNNHSNPSVSSNSNTLSFSGYTWRIKSSETPVGPGPNYFSNSPENVWVDEMGQLHLKITRKNGQWFCAEVISEKTFGYGTYRFYLASRIDLLNENVVLGLFTWDDDSIYYNREIDIEFSRWGDPTNDNAQFVVQPYFHTDNIHRFTIQLNGITQRTALIGETIV